MARNPMADLSLPIALTMGEPGGVSSEITVKAWQYFDQHPHYNLCFYVIDDPARYHSYDVPVTIIENSQQCITHFKNALPIIPLGENVSSQPGIASPKTANAVIQSIKTGVEHCLSKQAGAIVTNPIQKKALADIGFSFPGHTEYLADLTQRDPLATHTSKNPVMMLAGPELRCVPVTVHQSLQNAIKSLDREHIVKVACITHTALKTDFGIHKPRLAIAGLNPHAGEGGLFGSEDNDIILPAINIIRSKNIDVIGPLPADTMFHQEARNRYDAAICMYHDQALIPVKTLDFHKTVNVTLGLPIIRTSPDHGSALDIAGQGVANPTSLIEAIKLASDLITHRKNAH